MKVDELKISYNNGNLKVLCGMKGKLYHGKYEEWHENGEKKMYGHFHKGKECGEWSQWDENGRIMSINNYKNGVRDGEWRQWVWYEEKEKEKDKDKDKDKDKENEESKKNGKSEKKKGRLQLISIKRYKGGENIGKWIYWDKKGRVTRIESYKGGKKYGPFIYYDDNNMVCDVIVYGGNGNCLPIVIRGSELCYIEKDKKILLNVSEEVSLALEGIN